MRVQIFVVANKQIKLKYLFQLISFKQLTTNKMSIVTTPITEISIGYITCWSNQFLGNKHKITISVQKPIFEDDNDYRVTDEGVFAKFKLEICKKVTDPISKLRKLYHNLHIYRTEPESEFFVCDLMIINDAFRKIPEPRRELSTAFTNGQAIRHRVREHYRYGVFNNTSNKIMCNGKEYSLNKFALTHYTSEMSTRTTVNAWSECECLTNDGNWISTQSLPFIRQ